MNLENRIDDLEEKTGVRKQRVVFWVGLMFDKPLPGEQEKGFQHLQESHPQIGDEIWYGLQKEDFQDGRFVCSLCRSDKKN